MVFNKNTVRFILVVVVAIVLSAVAGCSGDNPPPSSTAAEPITTATAVPTTPAETTVPATTTAPVSTVPVTTPALPPGTTILFDFDTGTAAVLPGTTTPLEITANGLTARFSSPSDPAAFSIQSYDSTFLNLPRFSGRYLYQNPVFKTDMHITFDQPLAEISLVFAVLEYHGVGEVEQPTALRLTAYRDMAGTEQAGTATARGVPSDTTYPEGDLSFDAGGATFRMVVIELLYQQPGGTVFVLDDIAVTTPS
ncbi:MAG: hypothetical protein JW954_00465 [Dehalococcoidaceae bacterium]|nr:hypothetical protein [Dehalococcoidaceae bacterium]